MSKRFPNSEEQMVIYDVARGMFEDLLEQPGGLHSVHADAEVIHLLHAFDDGDFAPAPVEVLSRMALRDAAKIHAVKNVDPSDFF